MLHKVAVWFSW